jgi:CDP-diacylglycerol--glycerol-3-phosphate 3-phosphatidyltransferase
MMSLIISLAAAVSFFQGAFGLGGWLMIGGALFDLFDGMVARKTGQASPAGAFLDAVVDRYSELLCFIAIMGYYFPFQPAFAIIAGLAMVASVMITFNRAKGEALGLKEIPSGLMRRHERLFYLGVGTAASPLAALWLEPGATRPVFHLAVGALGLVAVVGNVAALRLVLQIHQHLKRKSVEKPHDFTP